MPSENAKSPNQMSQKTLQIQGEFHFRRANSATTWQLNQLAEDLPHQLRYPSGEVHPNQAQTTPRRGGRAADCTGLENRSPRKGTGGSNPPPSAGSFRDRRRQAASTPVAFLICGVCFCCRSNRTGCLSPWRIVTSDDISGYSGTEGSATLSRPVWSSLASVSGIFFAVFLDRFRLGLFWVSALD